jgi:carboxylesterase type B
VAFHLVANGGSGGAKLFRAAMMASGSVTGLEITKLGGSPSEQEQYEAMLKAANCSNASDGLECLRTAPINAIYEHENSTGAWEPVIDGDFIRREPALEMDDGNIARVPIMVGHNADEGLFVVNTLAGLLGFVPDNETQLREVIAQIQPTLDNSTIDRLLEAYPAHSPMPPYSLSIDYPWCPALRAVNLACGAEYRRLAAIFGDWFVDAGRRNMAEHWVKLGLPAYSYRFAANPTSLPIQVWIGLGPGFSIHGADLAYDFRLPGGFTTPIDFYPPVKNISSHEELSKVMADKFISFVHSLDPNAFSGELETNTNLRVPSDNVTDCRYFRRRCTEVEAIRRFLHKLRVQRIG